ncbi:MAG: nuclear transport factor 2 family protein [Candidatus Latescibacterota bacterium]|nr:MAG: nuclear transport factor 2 family protein [Candidatus Latescibacterota bacterium]
MRDDKMGDRGRLRLSGRIKPVPNIWRLITILVVAGYLMWGATAGAETMSEEDAILAVVQQFFDSMAAGDKDKAAATLMPDGQYYGLREDPDSLYLKRRTHQKYLEGLSSTTEAAVERMWNPTVLIHNRIAVVWAPYDFHVGGEFRHCGVDAFSLVKTEAGWRIAGIVYTIEPAGCGPSPLGPLERDEP